MSKSVMGRFLAVFVIVFVIGQLVTAVSFVLFAGPEMQAYLKDMSFLHMIRSIAGFVVIMLPGPIIPIILVSVFAANRIRNLSMIALAAAFTLMFVIWGTLHGGAFLIAFGFVESANRFLTDGFSAPLPDDLQIAFLYVTMAFVLFGVSILIIKLTAAVEQSFISRREKAA